MTTSTDEHDLLLRAALLDGDEAVDAWHEWRSRTSVDALDHDSQWLLPLLFRNLHAQGVPAEPLFRYRNVYRHHWYRNHLLLRQAAAAIDALQAAGRPVVVLGGGAMALRYHESPGARPFAAISVLTPWHTNAVPAADASRRGPEIEVRTSLFGEPWDDIVTARAIGSGWKTRPWRVLDPADQLVDICTRRHDWDRRSTLFWLADAATLLRRTPHLDWRKVAAVASGTGQEDEVTVALRTIAERCQLPLPAAALDVLGGAAIGAARRHPEGPTR